MPSIKKTQNIPNMPTCSSVESFSDENIHGRDIILLNPFADGGGDHELANKIANIAITENCRVTIIPIGVSIFTPAEDLPHRNISPQAGHEHEISSLHDPIVIIAPVDIMPVDKLKQSIEHIFQQYQFPKKDIVLIEEMNVLTSKNSMEKRVSCLNEMGFNSVTPCKLGFGDGAIGYLPVDQNTLTDIKNRFENELEKLMDSFNLSLDKQSNNHFAYISSDFDVAAAKVFILNTLTEGRVNGDINKENNNYIICMRQFDTLTKDTAQEAMKDILTVEGNGFYSRDFYANANILFANETDKNLEVITQLKGIGAGNINIIFTGHLPKNIFEDFICLSKSGMASGDQSLSEFISITGKLPYYDMQPFKQPLAYELVKMASETGGNELKDEIISHISGKLPFTGKPQYKFLPILKQLPETVELAKNRTELDRKIRSNTADTYIRNLLSSPN